MNKINSIQELTITTGHNFEGSLILLISFYWGKSVLIYYPFFVCVCVMKKDPEVFHPSSSFQSDELLSLTAMPLESKTTFFQEHFL